MSFLIIEVDPHPLKVRGERVIAATVIPLHTNKLGAAAYISARTGHRLQVKSVGLLADAISEARSAYAVMRPIGVTFDLSGRVATPCDIYVPVEHSPTIEAWHGELGSGSKWPDELVGYWVPVQLNTGSNQAQGWLRCTNGQCEIVVAVGSLANTQQVHATALHAAPLQTTVTNLQQSNVWNVQQEREPMPLNRSVVPV